MQTAQMIYLKAAAQNFWADKENGVCLVFLLHQKEYSTNSKCLDILIETLQGI